MGNKLASLRFSTRYQTLRGSIRVGLTGRLSEVKGFDALIKVADQGVYAVEDAGKNCVRSVC